MMWNMDGWWGFGMGFGWIFPLLAAGLIVWAVVSLTRSGARPNDGAKPSDGGALPILKQRYARGELTREEFKNMRRDIA